MTRRRITTSALEAYVSALQAPVYGLATALIVAAVALDGAPPGIAWGMFLIGCALVVAARNASGTGRARDTGPARSADARR